MEIKYAIYYVKLEVTTHPGVQWTAKPATATVSRVSGVSLDTLGLWGLVLGKLCK